MVTSRGSLFKCTQCKWKVEKSLETIALHDSNNFIQQYRSCLEEECFASVFIFYTTIGISALCQLCICMLATWQQCLECKLATPNQIWQTQQLLPLLHMYTQCITLGWLCFSQFFQTQNNWFSTFCFWRLDSQPIDGAELCHSIECFLIYKQYKTESSLWIRMRIR